MDTGNIAELNAFLVLDAIRSHGKVTRRQLSAELGLSDASVSRIAQRLLRADLIAEEQGDRPARGRTPTVLRFVGAAGSVIAIDLGGTRCHGVLADLAGTTMTEDFRPTREGKHAAAALLECIAALRPDRGSRSWPVRAVVGIPAPDRPADRAVGLAQARARAELPGPRPGTPLREIGAAMGTPDCRSRCTGREKSSRAEAPGRRQASL